MGQNVTIAGASYPDVPALDVPKTGGGTARFVDTADDTVTPATLKSGVTAHDASGAKITGTLDTTPPEESDINFWDYDGTLLYAWTLAELATKTELPPLPSHDGLICQGWNWTLADIKAQGTKMDVGASYITDDGATRLYLEIPEGGVLTIPLLIGQTVANGVSISWGDGQTETISGTGNVQTSHTYAAPGRYTLSLLPADGCAISFGHVSGTANMLGTINYADLSRQSLVKRVELGRGFTALAPFALQSMRALRTITIPIGVTTTRNAALSQCEALRALILPSSINTTYPSTAPFCTSLQIVSMPKSQRLNNNQFASCYSLHRVCFSKGNASVGNNSMQNCYALSEIYGLENVAVITGAAFQNCRCLCNDLPPLKITSIPANCFSGCYSLRRLRFAAAITSIAAGAFFNCYSMASYDFTSCTAVPTLANANAFTNIQADCEIRVPASLVDSWKAATNWSTYADHIVGVET